MNRSPCHETQGRTAVPGPNTAQAPIAVEDLRSRLAGRVIVPGDTDYETARVVTAGHIDRRPAAIARVANAADIAAVISFARETRTELAVRSGGHDGAGHSTTDGG